MIPNDHIWQICLRAVEEKFNEGPYEDWTKSTYERLSKTITEDTGQGISSSTLKRIFGKVKYEHKPQQEVKDVLAVYIGYPNWTEFVVAHTIDKHSSADEVVAEVTKLSPLIKGIIGLLILVVGYLIYYYATPPAGEFVLREKAGKAPFQARWDYDLSGMKGNDVYIDYNDLTHREDILIDPDKYSHTYSFRVPDVYYVCFKYQEGRNWNWIGCDPVVVYSDGWHTSLIDYYSENFVIKDLRSNDPFIQNHQLHVTPSIVSKYGLDTNQTYWTKYRYVKDFQLPGETFSVEVMAKAESFQKGVDCPELIINVMGDINEVEIPFSYPGCGAQDAHFTIGDSYFKGTDRSMDAFLHDLTSWTKIILRVKDQHLICNINNKEVYNEPFTGAIGNIQGIMLQMRGKGYVDYVRIYNKMNAMVFNDEFGRVRSAEQEHQ